MDVAQLHQRSLDYFGRQVDAVGEEKWAAPTNCGDWSVRDLVNHVVGEDLWTAPLFEGKTIAEVGDAYDGDVVGDKPALAYADAAAAAAAAVRAPGATDRIVHLSFGDTPGSEYAMQLFADHLIHGWDLAHSIGADDTLDPELVSACADWFGEREHLYRGAGAVGERPDVPADADPQTRLLAAFGRSR